MTLKVYLASLTQVTCMQPATGDSNNSHPMLASECADPEKLGDILRFHIDSKLDPTLQLSSRYFACGVNLLVWSIWWGHALIQNDDTSVQDLLLEKKVPVEAHAGMGVYQSHLLNFMCFSATAVRSSGVKKGRVRHG